MNKQEKEEIRGIQQQWALTVIGVMLALFAGVTINAFYDILKENLSLWCIFLTFGIPLVFIIDFFSYLMDNLGEYRKEPDGSFWKWLGKYGKSRVAAIKALFRE